MVRLTAQELAAITRQEIAWYAGFSDDSNAYSLLDDEKHIYAVTIIKNEPGPKRSLVMMQARIEGDFVVVDDDTVWDKQLWKALVQAGVPREQIVLAYAGEQVPMTSEG